MTLAKYLYKMKGCTAMEIPLWSPFKKGNNILDTVANLC